MAAKSLALNVGEHHVGVHHRLVVKNTDVSAQGKYFQLFIYVQLCVLLGLLVINPESGAFYAAYGVYEAAAHLVMVAEILYRLEKIFSLVDAEKKGSSCKV